MYFHKKLLYEELKQGFLFHGSEVNIVAEEVIHSQVVIAIIIISSYSKRLPNVYCLASFIMCMSSLLIYFTYSSTSSTAMLS